MPSTPADNKVVFEMHSAGADQNNNTNAPHAAQVTNDNTLNAYVMKYRNKVVTTHSTGLTPVAKAKLSKEAIGQRQSM